MAIRTGFHVEILGANRRGLLIHAAVAGFAAYAFVHMNLVIEIDIIRQAVHPVPLYWSSIGITVTDGLQAGLI